jgi:hypothetical protein
MYVQTMLTAGTEEVWAEGARCHWQQCTWFWRVCLLLLRLESGFDWVALAVSQSLYMHKALTEAGQAQSPHDPPCVLPATVLGYTYTEQLSVTALVHVQPAHGTPCTSHMPWQNHLCLHALHTVAEWTKGKSCPCEVVTGCWDLYQA